MRRLFPFLFSSGRSIPTSATVFLLAGIIGFLQLPISFLLDLSDSLGIIINEAVVIAGLPFLLARLCHFDRRRLFPLHLPSARSTAASLLLLGGGVLALEYLITASELLFPLPLEYRQKLDQLMAAPSPLLLTWKLFLLAWLPGICEELFFRGFAQTSFAAEKGTMKGIVLASLLFALMHGNPWYVHLYFLLSLLFSIVYASEGTLLLPMLCHVLNNAWTILRHQQDIAFPLQGFTAPLDLSLMGIAVLLILVAARELRLIRGKNEIASHPRHRPSLESF